MVGIPNGPKCRVDVELLVLVPGTGRSIYCEKVVVSSPAGRCELRSG